MASNANVNRTNNKKSNANNQALLEEMAHLAEAAKTGHLSERANLEKVDGESKILLQRVNEILDAILIPIGEGNRVLAQISAGKIDELIIQTYNGDHEKMKQAINNVATVLQGLQKELGRLTIASREGQLNERGKTDQFKGAYGEIVLGVNTMLDAILLPIGEGNRILAQVSAGKIDELITQTYKGDHEKMKQAINNVAAVLQDLKKEVNRLTGASLEGQLSERGKADQFKGAYGEIVLGVNTMLDAILLPIGEGNRVLGQVSNGKIDELIAQSYKGDHEKMKQAINNVALVLQNLQKEMGRLTIASREGQLNERGKADQFKGAYGEIVQGVNTMLDAILLPIGEGNRVLAQVSIGNLNERVEIACKGDHEKMKNAINDTAAAIRKLVEEMNRLSKASSDGMLSTRGKPEQFKGSYADVVIGVNTMLDAILMPINEAAEVLEKVAARDMAARVKGDYKGDHAKIKVSLNTAVENLDTALSQVAEATEQVSSGSQQIASGSQSLAQGTNEQASSLEEVSSSLEEMSSMTKQNADSANQAKNLAVEANSNANSGTQAMTQMSTSINKIKESSDQTAKIVKTIDEIAMQTNLLALNAAVEAARAGEAGRGFAVVAEEVRNLAQRSAQAAKNTADMISESVKNADEGVKIATEVSKSFEAITVSVKKVNDLIAEIAAASGEQSQGIDQVNTAVAQMDKVTQQNAANSEESASAAEEMSSQAEELQSMIAQFSLSSTVQKKTGPVHSQVTHAKPVAHQKPAAPKFETKLHHGATGKGAKPVSAGKTNAEAAIPMHDEVLKEF
jgi:methyl-accepting chemotaxis protein